MIESDIITQIIGSSPALGIAYLMLRRSDKREDKFIEAFNSLKGAIIDLKFETKKTNQQHESFSQVLQKYQKT